MLASRTVFRAFGARRFEPLLDAREHADLADLAGSLPFVVQAHGLELKLCEDAAHADYLVCLDSVAETIASVRAFVARKARAGSPLSRVETLLRAWSMGSSAVRRHFPQLWLEWDRPGGVTSSAPGLFLAPARSDSPVPKAPLRRALRTLYSETAARRHEGWIARITGLLPAGARLRHVGAMPGRDPDFLRLVLEDVPRDSLAPLLRQIGWPGDQQALERLLADTARKTDCVPKMIDLDFLDHPTAALGLEYVLVGDDRPADGGLRLIDDLLANDLVGPEEARALRGWLGWDVHDAEGPEQGALWAKLYHVKLSLSGGGTSAAPPVRAKAYLGFFGGPSARFLREMHAALQRRPLRRTSNPGET